MEVKKNTYRERASKTAYMSPEEIAQDPKTAALLKQDSERLKKTRPDWGTDGKHSQESIMRGIEEGEVAEKSMVGRAVNKLKTNLLGSNVDNELAAERESERKRGTVGKKKGGMIKSSASKRADGCAIRGKTRA
jgi:hypothetical protein